jgi:hypothetical protein
MITRGREPGRGHQLAYLTSTETPDGQPLIRGKSPMQQSIPARIIGGLIA